MHSHWKEDCNFRIATAVLQCRSTTAISSFVFLNYSLPNSTNHLTKLNLILEVVSECKTLSLWWWTLGWKMLPPTLVGFRGGKGQGWDHNIEDHNIQNILRIALSQRIGYDFGRQAYFFPLHLIRTPWVFQSDYIEESVTYTMKILYCKNSTITIKVYTSVKMWLEMWHSLISPKPKLPCILTEE